MLTNTVICDWGVSITLALQKLFWIYCDSFIHETVLHYFACCCKILSTSFKLSSCRGLHSQLDIRTAHFLQQFIASENSLCYLFALTARRKLHELFDNVTTARQFHNAILDSLTCTNDALSSEAFCRYYPQLAFVFILVFAAFWRNKVEYICGLKTLMIIIIIIIMIISNMARVISEAADLSPDCSDVEIAHSSFAVVGLVITTLVCINDAVISTFDLDTLTRLCPKMRMFLQPVIGPGN